MNLLQMNFINDTKIYYNSLFNNSLLFGQHFKLCLSFLSPHNRQAPIDFFMQFNFLRKLQYFST